ncbi:MAG: mucoidy inhibitor MuiA family protein [Bacteroidales bacterium]|nr:mucoidy inhibitor MuiA family protein [Bacteroidales bacterium]
MKRTIIFSFLMLWAVFSLSAQNEFTAKIDHATVYLQGAALTHTATASLKSGSYDVMINGLSPDIEIASLKVSANGVLISASEFSNDYITPKEESARIKKLQDSLDTYKRQLQEAKDELIVHTHLLKMLTDGTLNNMSQKDGTVSVADINANMELYKSKAAPLQHSIDQDNLKIAKLDETVKRLQRQISQDQSKDKQRTGVLRLTVSVPQTVNTVFTITYFTDMAGWVPCYDINIASMDKPVVLKSKAQVTQVTGIDWNNVKLTLSNATPNRTKEAPVFKTWFLSFYNPHRQGRSYIVDGVQAKSNSLTYATASLEGVSAKDAESSSARTPTAPLVMDDYVDVDMQEVAVNYNISVPYDIPGNGKEQLIDLKSYDIKADYKYYCAPKLSDETYLIADLSDYEQYNLLPGYATVTFENTFVGRTFLRPNVTEEHISLTLTTDPRISVKREKMSNYCSTKHVGNTTAVTQAYQITVKNNQTKSVKLTLKEQYPISNNKDIEVKLGDVTPAATYNKEGIGVLTWDVELKAGETRTFSVSYSVKYPKDQNVNL